jgi:hypothetical protein
MAMSLATLSPTTTISSAPKAEVAFDALQHERARLARAEVVGAPQAGRHLVNRLASRRQAQTALSEVVCIEVGGDELAVAAKAVGQCRGIEAGREAHDQRLRRRRSRGWPQAVGGDPGAA